MHSGITRNIGDSRIVKTAGGKDALSGFDDKLPLSIC
jgi:hypothetical protein